MEPELTRQRPEGFEGLPRSVFGGRFLPYLLLAAIAMGVQFQAGDVPELDGYDEQAYGHFVRTFSERGFDGLRQLIHSIPVDKKLQIAPLPLRLTFIMLGAIACKLAGG